MSHYLKTIVLSTITTGYFPPPVSGYASPEEAAMEGGAFDCHGMPLHTLQDHLDGTAPYVSVAIDAALMKGLIPYGTLLTFPAINRFYKREVIDFRAVDTGGAFTGKGTARMDICVRDRKASLNPLFNREHIVIVLAIPRECRECVGKK